MPDGDPPIFISHAQADHRAALALATWLKGLFEAEVFVSSMSAGEEWRRIFTALRNCSVGVVCFRGPRAKGAEA